MTTAVAEVPLRATVGSPGHVIIATINRLQGSTGVHTHTTTLHRGITAAGARCDVVTAFDAGPHWLGMFAVRKLLDRLHPGAAVRWYRYWHEMALRSALTTYIHNLDLDGRASAGGKEDLSDKRPFESGKNSSFIEESLRAGGESGGLPRFQRGYRGFRPRLSKNFVIDRFFPNLFGATAKPMHSHAQLNGVFHIIAQCPVSAHAALEVRRSLGLSFPITLVCHFNHSEAREYRDLGQLDDSEAYASMLAYEANVLRTVDRVVYVSDWARSVVEHDRQIVPRESVVIHNGICANVDVAASRRESIGALPDDIVLMNVGTLEPRKSQLRLLDLFQAVVREQPRARLVLVGEGADREKIERRASELSIANRVMLLGHRGDVASLLPLADMYVHYATAENCPIVLLEAARAGLPWAAVAEAGVVELQRKLGGCVRLDPSDIAGSAKRVVEVIKNPDLARRLGSAARQHFQDQFTQKAMTQSYLAALGIAAEAGA